MAGNIKARRAVIEAFLEASVYIDYYSETIQRKIPELFSKGMCDIERAETAYKFVRDEILHSFDCNAQIITAKASEVLKYGTGICHAKANLLAALLRSQGIPAGFCFQRITLMEEDSFGYCIHAYNAVFLNHKWIKLDARGNKPGIHARFSMDEPVLAYSNRQSCDEYFLKGIYASPHLATMRMLKSARCLRDVFDNIPDKIEGAPDIRE